MCSSYAILQIYGSAILCIVSEPQIFRYSVLADAKRRRKAIRTSILYKLSLLYCNSITQLDAVSDVWLECDNVIFLRIRKHNLAGIVKTLLSFQFGLILHDTLLAFRQLPINNHISSNANNSYKMVEARQPPLTCMPCRASVCFDIYRSQHPTYYAVIEPNKIAKMFSF